ncbi:hypothetical protein SKAU_G00236870 [Synaphobranchus kaupii]|uniref:L1 transposable element RRM domain-containing protein n=1 Tax=Synaphobranchus kaupii TaxID=118154 RepID=A0A9Q1ITY1_SYNKA|nr:hypothetical protein SKAU_G00236870 [Synaphobranchus kaupii]
MEKDMSTSPAREGRKREVEQSPIKKKFKDSSLSREDLDDAITGGIRLALQEQQRTLDAAVTSAVKEAVNSILIPQLRSIKVDIEQTNEYVRGLRTDFEHQAKIAQKTQNRVDSIQLAVREDRQGIVELQKQVEQLTQKTADMEDRARRNNVRRGIEIDRAHRIYNGREQNSDRPRTLIFRLLRWQDRTAILREARKAYPVKHHKSTLLFFPDYSAPTTTKRKGFNPAIKDARDMGLQPFLIYPATLKLDHGGKKLTFDCPQKAEDFIRSLKSSQQPHRPESYASAVRRDPAKMSAGPVRPSHTVRSDPGDSIAVEVHHDPATEDDTVEMIG